VTKLLLSLEAIIDFLFALLILGVPTHGFRLVDLSFQTLAICGLSLLVVLALRKAGAHEAALQQHAPATRSRSKLLQHVPAARSCNTLPEQSSLVCTNDF